MTDGSDRWQELDSRAGSRARRHLRRRRICGGSMKSSGPTSRPVGTTSTMWNCTAVWPGERPSSGRLRDCSHDGGEEGRTTCHRPPYPPLPSSFRPRPSCRRRTLQFGGFLFSYAVAAATVAIGLLVGWMYQSPSRSNRSRRKPAGGPRRRRSRKRPNVQLVGQITGMFDCQWADASTPAIDRAYVPLGRRYALASGLMEISYDSGAKVILQGPCIYQVESKISGYLGLGTLTAKVEKSGEGRGERAERREASQDSTINNHESSPLPCFPFALPRPSSPISAPSSPWKSTSRAPAGHMFLSARSRFERPTAGTPQQPPWGRTNRPASILARTGSPSWFVNPADGARSCARCPSRCRSCCSTPASA